MMAAKAFVGISFTTLVRLWDGARELHRRPFSWSSLEEQKG